MIHLHIKGNRVILKLFNRGRSLSNGALNLGNKLRVSWENIQTRRTSVRGRRGGDETTSVNSAAWAQHAPSFLLGPSNSNKKNQKHHFQQNWQTDLKISTRTSKISSWHRSQGRESKRNKAERSQQQQISTGTKQERRMYVPHGLLTDEGPTRGRPLPPTCGEVLRQ